MGLSGQLCQIPRRRHCIRLPGKGRKVGVGVVGRVVCRVVGRVVGVVCRVVCRVVGVAAPLASVPPMLWHDQPCRTSTRRQQFIPGRIVVVVGAVGVGVVGRVVHPVEGAHRPDGVHRPDVVHPVVGGVMERWGNVVTSLVLGGNIIDQGWVVALKMHPRFKRAWDPENGLKLYSEISGFLSSR